MRFLADESCDFAVGRALRAEGHAVTAVAEVAAGASDEKVIATAIPRVRCSSQKTRTSGSWFLRNGAPRAA